MIDKILSLKGTNEIGSSFVPFRDRQVLDLGFVGMLPTLLRRSLTVTRTYKFQNLSPIRSAGRELVELLSLSPRLKVWS